MKLMFALMILAVFMIAIAFALAAFRGQREECHNEATTAGTHEDGKVPFVAEEAFATRHLLAKKGTGATQILNGTANAKPWGTCLDEPGAGDGATVAVLGSVRGTLLMRASEAIAVGADVYTAAAGKVQDLPAGAGTYYKVGVAITAAAADGDLFEVAPCSPVATVVS